MNIDEALEILNDEDGYEFGISNRILRGLKRLESVMEDGYDLDVRAEHDQIWCADFSETVERMSEEDVRYMRRLGWFEDCDSWSHFT